MVTVLGGLEINNKEKAICSVLGSDPRHIDLIVRDTGIASQKLSGILLDLAMKGVLKQTEVKRFVILQNNTNQDHTPAACTVCQTVSLIIDSGSSA
jgi:hypothetical protein